MKQLLNLERLPLWILVFVPLWAAPTWAQDLVGQEFLPTEIDERVEETVGPRKRIAMTFEVTSEAELVFLDLFLRRLVTGGINPGTTVNVLHTTPAGAPDETRAPIGSGSIPDASLSEEAQFYRLQLDPVRVSPGKYAVAVGGGLAGGTVVSGALGNRFLTGEAFIQQRTSLVFPFPSFSAHGNVDFYFRTILRTLAVAPTVIVQPESRVVELGGATTFFVEAVGTEPLEYQWWFERRGTQIATAIPNARESSLRLNNTQRSDEGDYYVIVSNQSDRTISQRATLRVNSSPSIAPISDFTLVQGGQLRVQATATDPDLPAQTLVFTMDGNPPAGASITPSGQFEFNSSPTLPPGSYPITVAASDVFGSKGTRFFTIILQDRLIWEQPTITDLDYRDGKVGFGIQTQAPRFWTVQSTSLPLSANPEWLDAATFFGGAPYGFQQEASEPGRAYRVREAEVMSKSGSLLITGTLSAPAESDAYLEVDVNDDGVVDEVIQADAEDGFAMPIDGLVRDLRSRLLVVKDGAETRSAWTVTRTLHDPGLNTGNETFRSLVLQAGLCGCIECDEKTAMRVGGSLTPQGGGGGVDFATGQLRVTADVTGLPGIEMGVNANLTLVTLVEYNGPFGQGVTHALNWQIIQTGEFTGRVVTETGREFSISSSDGLNWVVPSGVLEKLTLNPLTRQWHLTRVNGVRRVFFQNSLNKPGYLISATSPNGNQIQVGYNECFNSTRFANDRGQQLTAAYTPNPHLQTLTDHLGRTWTMTYDAQNRLIEIASPPTEFADIEPGVLVTDTTLKSTLATKPRRTTFNYGDPRFPNHLTAIIDERGAVTRSWTYDAQGRVGTATVNGNTTTLIYGSAANPAPLPVLDSGNIVTREIDPEGNTTDYEMHGPNHIARFGLRRKVTWTETGKGNPPLRTGEPAYREQRWLHDCECLAPIVITQPFSDLDSASLTFDANAIPQNWPRIITTYNGNKQVLTSLYTDGTETIRNEMTYQLHGHGENDKYSLLLTRTEARAFDGNPIDAGLNFVHSYQYDSRGNRIRHIAPMVTRGVGSPQVVEESWTYNQFGQVVTHTDPNGNRTINTYHSGPIDGGNINTRGNFFGFLASVTRGASGSVDLAVNLQTSYLVNALGQVTQMIDPMGRAYDTEFNDLGEVVRTVEPQVTLRNGQTLRYETRHLYDGAGNLVMTSRTNVNHLGQAQANATIDHSMSYDAANNVLTERREVDANDVNDLMTTYAYDRNEQPIAVQKPEGNRVFTVYDERRMSFKQFAGVAPGAGILSGYPTDKRAVDLGGTSFVALTRSDYDSRGNPVVSYDGRGNSVIRGFDFRNRQVFQSDQNRNGWVRYYDDAGNVLATEQGAMPAADGVLSQVLARSYARFDELGRQYQAVQDINPATSELGAVDPAGADNSSFLTRFDPGSRSMASVDANGNATMLTYDTASRRTTVTDALNNTVTSVYDLNSNVTEIRETEVAGPGASGPPETYHTTFQYDELNRRSETHIRGLNSTIDHRFETAYDSRGNAVLLQDAEGKCALNTLDDLNRLVGRQRFNADPVSASSRELQRSEFNYDKNSRKIADIAYSDLANPASAQITRYAHNHADWLIRTVYPDSDDPIEGSGNGPDGLYDRIEVTYDANGNPQGVKEQREVVFANAFDPANRLTDQFLTLPPSVPGTTRQGFGYDPLNRLTHAANNYSRVDREYDAFSRQTNETQSVRLDGLGFVNGWEQPVRVECSFDKQSNPSSCLVTDGPKTDLNVGRTFDALNRVASISAAYFNVARRIADYAYFGPGRTQTKTLGNGVRLTTAYDAKRRVESMNWTDPVNLLVGLEYGYDLADNLLFERFGHDRDLYDHYGYNDRDELTHVEYRSADPNRPASWRDTFDYDDNYNRRSAAFGGPFAPAPEVTDTYSANPVNEYTDIVRNSIAFTIRHDGAGNMTRFLVRPATVNLAEEVEATARWDAFNCLFNIENPATGQRQYRYDPFRRRIAMLESETRLHGSRRFICEGWSDVEERVFNPSATLANAPSTPERIYVEGPRIDEHLLTAIDRNGDGQLGGANLKNQRDITADQEYFHLQSRLGSTMALSDAVSAARILEFVRYSVHGEAILLGSIDNNSDGREDTPQDLADNANGDADQLSGKFGNTHLFAGRFQDQETGLLYYRH